MFKGEANPQVAEAWLMQIDKLLNALDVQRDQDKIALVSIQLEAEANHWWNMVKTSRQVEEMTWGEFQQMFYEKYFPAPIRQELAREFMSLTQGKMTVTQYANKFESLSRHATGVLATEAEKARRFEWGLDPVIRRGLLILQLSTYMQVVDRAIASEREIADSRRTLGQQSKPAQSQVGPIKNTKNNFNNAPYNCCNQQQQWRAGNQGRQAWQSMGGKCYNCGQ